MNISVDHNDLKALLQWLSAAIKPGQMELVRAWRNQDQAIRLPKTGKEGLAAYSPSPQYVRERMHSYCCLAPSTKRRPSEMA